MVQFDNAERKENLSYAIGYYRKKRGYSQEQMAERLGISRQHLASVEAPGMDRGVSLELLFNIAAVLEIEPYLLLKFVFLLPKRIEAERIASPRLPVNQATF